MGTQWLQWFKACVLGSVCPRRRSLKETEELRSAHERFVTYVQTNLKYEFALILAEHDLPRRFERLKQLTEGGHPGSPGESSVPQPPSCNAELQALQIAVDQKERNLQLLDSQIDECQAQHVTLNGEVEEQQQQMQIIRSQLAELVERFGRVASEH